ncbi:hypothetical protein EX30DRAFT_321196 [Ascodesmis nigricans]|uniref:Uncharacterized protein n=1 Tax=Ascodesmis nigricans TaxID=341454 RepID=A0A4S2MT19_9PEZI|nr:hypothetical protein EX30DRAFT_321196 [Ascodesmis nigricans]
MSSRTKPLRGAKKATASTRKFAYQSFSQKIANLKIDPARVVRRYVDDEETQNSNFQTAYEKWIELNLTATFTQFAKEVRPLSESLPLIVHHKDRIFDLLYSYIDKRDPLALEPLLDLLAQFAHDLGALFEPYLSRSVKLLSSLVAKYVDFSTIEWTFNCLAYLLKYLSRFLTPNLRPLYDIWAPLLGRESQKSFVTRFAAEAISFLIRKAKDQALRDFVRHVLEDLEKNADNSKAAAYSQGVITAFHEACISINQNIHSRGTLVFDALLTIATEAPEVTKSTYEVVEGVLVGLIHHTNQETFQPVLKCIYEFVDRKLPEDSITPSQMAFIGMLLNISATVRKGSRIVEWGPMAEQTMRVLNAAFQTPGTTEGSREAVWSGLKGANSIMQYSSLDVVISKCSRVAEKAKEWNQGELFLAFSELVAETGQERFKQFVLPTLQRFMIGSWNRYHESLCILIPKLQEAGAFTVKQGEKSIDLLGANSPILASAFSEFDKFEKALSKSTEIATEPSLTRSWGYLSLLGSLPLPQADEKLRRRVQKLLTGICSVSSAECLAPLAGKALSIIAILDPSELSAANLLSLMSEYHGNAVFLQGLLDCLRRPSAPTFSGDEQDKICDYLILNLSSCNHDVRKLSILLIEKLPNVLNSNNSEPSEVINTLNLIEHSPFTIPNQRNLSMYVRKLGMEYAHFDANRQERRIIPAYLFGLMTVKFAPLWEDSAKALSQIVDTEETLVAEYAFKWLSGESLPIEESIINDDSPMRFDLTPFQCSNVLIVDKIANRCMANSQLGGEKLREILDRLCVSSIVPAPLARTQALYLLCEIPRIAEKRSRQLVPMFFEWSRHGIYEEDDTEQHLDVSSAETRKWSRRDRISMLTLFSKFTNSKVLYRSDEVYTSMLGLLASGDNKTQTLALKCILTWKNPAVKAYEDRLNNLLDETMFRDELTNFVQVDSDATTIQGQHRAELMPVLLRLLYGRSLSRKHASSGKKGMSSTRTAILTSLASFLPEEKALFIEITLGDLAKSTFVDKSNSKQFTFNKEALSGVNVSLRKQIGFVRMVEDVFKQLGTTIQPQIGPLVEGVLHCLVGATDSLADAADSEEEGDGVMVKALKSVRTGGFKSLNLMFHYCPSFNWKPYMPAIFDNLINPRMEKLPTEASQSVSSIPQLFSSWASSRHTILFLCDYNTTVLPTLAKCLDNEHIKDEVVSFIIQILAKIVQIANSIDEATEEVAKDVKERLIIANIDALLQSLSNILQKSLQRELLEQCIEGIASLAAFVTGTTDTTKLVEICVFLLSQPPRRVNPKIKSDILRILVNALPNCVMEKGDTLYEDIYRTVCSLFGFFKDRVSRQMLAMVLNVFAQRDEDLREVADLSIQLNAFSKKRLDEPDFDLRLAAYEKINEHLYKNFNAKQWLPLLYNMFFYIKDNEELALRTSASYALKRFAEMCGTQLKMGDGTDPLNKILVENVLPILRNGASEASEIVRVEYISVMAHVVKECATLEEIRDMRPLLMDDDEEASFFNNVLHIQQHRRLRALRRLASTSREHEIQSHNIAQFLLPLIEHFVFDMEKEAHNLANEAVRTIGALMEQLKWTQYRAVFKRYLGFIKSKPDLAKIVIRLVGVAVDALVCATGGDILASASTKDDDEDEEEDNVDESGDTQMKIEESPSKRITRLTETLPEQAKFAEEISNAFLPIMIAHLHEKDESTVALRVPVAVSVVKLLRMMPEDIMKGKLPGTLMDVCHILRSRNQDDRDMTRKTLADIALLLGPQYLSFIIKELKGSLQRGYQLHVLSYTVHSILVVVVPKFPTGSIDHCSPMIVDIIMDDIFGVTGSEKDAEGYISKMKEVRSSKSYDSMDILAETTTLPYLGGLVRPTRDLLMEKLTGKMITKIDELLRRITVGLLRNASVNDRNLLVFCYEIVQEVYKATSKKAEDKPKDEKRARYLVNLKVPSKAQSTVATSSHVFKLTKFALEIMRTLLRKHEDLATPQNLANFVPIIGDAVLSNIEEVQISALRLLTTIIKVPLKEIDDGALVFVDKARTFIKLSPSTNAELPQASLKFIAAILKDRPSVKVKDTIVGYLLTRIKPDLEEPHLQGVTFNFIKSVLSRKLTIAEVYDVMDAVAAIMITNQTRSVRDECRRLYFQFLMDYPQSKDRWRKQQAFLVQNLTFKHESGRLSVLDAMHLVATKMGDNIIQDILDTFFAPLVMALINDESQQCREMVGEVIKDVFRRADEERTQKFLGLLRIWISGDQKTPVNLMALQVYGLYFDVAGPSGKGELKSLTKRLQEIVETAKSANDDTDDTALPEWEPIYRALQLWKRLAQLFPDQTLSGSYTDMWKGVQQCLRYPHAWARTASSQLIGLLFAGFTQSDLQVLPIDNGRGLTMDGPDLISIAWAISSQLNSPELSEELGQQVAKNLFFLGKCFYANKIAAPSTIPQNEQLDDIEEEKNIKSALSWLMSRLSGVIRSERNIKRGLVGKKYSLGWLAMMIQQIITAEDLISMAPTIILPLFNLTELPEGHTMLELKPTAQEILDTLSKKIGTTEYAKAYAGVKQQVADRRQQRRTKRKIEAVAEPELAAKRKAKKHEREKARKKEKGKAHKEYRLGRKL